MNLTWRLYRRVCSGNIYVLRKVLPFFREYRPLWTVYVQNGGFLSSLVFECLCIHAVLKIESIMRACRCDLYSFIFYTTKCLPPVHWDPSVCMTHQWKLKNTPNWIVGVKLTELHEKSIKNQMQWGNKSYTNWVDVDLHFMLVVEVIKLNRIFNLFMTLDATYCDVQLIYGLAQIS